MAPRILDSTTRREELSFIDVGKIVGVEGSAEKIQIPTGFLRRDVATVGCLSLELREGSGLEMYLWDELGMTAGEHVQVEKRSQS